MISIVDKGTEDDELEKDDDTDQLIRKLEEVKAMMADKGHKFYLENLRAPGLILKVIDVDFVWQRVHGMLRAHTKASTTNMSITTEINAALNGRILQQGGFASSGRRILQPIQMKHDTNRTNVIETINAGNIDKEQKRCILDVIAGRPLVILEAPGGTGKTQTISNTVTMLMNLKDDTRILVIVKNNEALAEVTNRMMATMDGRENADKTILVMSAYANPGSLSKASKKLTLKHKAKELMQREDVPPKVKKMVEQFLEICEEGKVSVKGLGTIKNKIIDWVKPQLIFATIDMVTCQKRLRQGINVVILDEISLAADLHTRVLLTAPFGAKRQIFMVGDPEQLGPYTTLETTRRYLVKYGKKSVAQQIMSRRAFAHHTLIYNRRSIPELIPGLNVISNRESYKQMRSAIPMPDVNDETYVYPPAVREDGAYILLEMETRRETRERIDIQ